MKRAALVTRVHALVEQLDAIVTAIEAGDAAGIKIKRMTKAIARLAEQAQQDTVRRELRKARYRQRHGLAPVHSALVAADRAADRHVRGTCHCAAA